jgi:hypothetical protein
MEWNWSAVFSEMRLSLQSPRAGLRRILQINPPIAARWIGLVLIAIANTFVMVLSLRLVPADEVPPLLASFMTSPMQLAVMQVLGIALMALAVHWLGRFTNGKGTLEDSLLMIVWFQMIMFVAQLVQLAVEVLVPPLSGLAFLGAALLFFWLLTNFVAELQGYTSLVLTFFGVFVALTGAVILASFGIALIFALTGTALPS